MPYLTAYAIIKLNLIENGSTTEQDMIDDCNANCYYAVTHDGSDSKIISTELLEVSDVNPCD
jgi:hypothetical protein